MQSNKVKSIQRLGFPWQTQDPFIFCAYHRDLYPNGNEHMGPDESLAGRNIGQDFNPQLPWRMYHGSTVPGFPQHPHRGFETVTIATEGLVDHADSLGAAGRFGNGDVQWMTAGKGVLHSEMFPLLKKNEDNPLELFQIWLNLPSSSKMVEPHFKMLWAEDIPTHTERDAKGHETTVKVIAGRIGTLEGPAPTPDSWASNPEHHVAIWTIKMAPEAEWTIPAAIKGLGRTLYCYEGESLDIEGDRMSVNHFAEVDSGESLVLRNGKSAASILLLQGKAIGEPVAQHGPFVMNTEAEIREAFAEFRQTQFGGWPWERNDQVHGSSRGRFALHSDGHEEVKEATLDY